MSSRRNKSKMDQQRRNQQREDDDEDGEVLRRHTHESNGKSSVFNNVAMGAIGAAAIGLGGYFLSKVFSSSPPAYPRYVTTADECKEILQRIREDLLELPVLGLDCQLTESFDGERNRIAVLQLATYKGKFVVIAMNKLNSFPSELKEILRNREIIKTGLNVIEDSRWLHADYGLEVNSTFDLRFLVEDTGNQPDELEKLSHNILNLDLNCDLVKSNWDQESLEPEQMKYAELSVKACVDIFKTLIAFVNVGSSNRDIIKYCEPNFDTAYTKRSER